MTISNIEIDLKSQGFRASCAIKVGSEQRMLFYETEDCVQPPSPEMVCAAFAAAALPVACWRGEDVHLTEACDSEFLLRSQLIARAYRRLHKLERNITVQGPTASSPPHPNRSATCSFSGGVDSLFSVLRGTLPDALNPVRSATTIFGVDIPFDDFASIAKVREKLRRFTSSKSLNHHFVWTNYRQVFDDIAPWGPLTHGACLASVGFAMSGEVHTYLLPSSSVIDNVYAWGSHPMIDNSFVSTHTRVFNDQWEFYRNEKVEFISQDFEALACLKVCNKQDRTSNCCKCEKCLRTMAMLLVLGKLDIAESFPQKLTLEQLRKHKIRNKKEIYRFERLLQEAQTRGKDEVVSAVRLVLNRGRRRLLRRHVLRQLRLHS